MKISVSDLKQNISGVLARAQSEDIVIKHGKPVAVLVRIEAYKALVEQTKSGRAFDTAYDFFITLPSVADFEVQHEPFKLRDIGIA